MLNNLAKNWWMLIARGIFALVFGFFAILVPGVTLTALIISFGLYALLDGAISLYVAWTDWNQYKQWWIGVLEGSTGIIVGILTFIWPGITGLILLYFIAVWAIATGILEIWATFQLYKEFNSGWLLGFSGVLSILLGVLLLISPATGALAVIFGIGFYAILFGGMLIVLGFQLRNASDSFLRTNEF